MISKINIAFHSKTPTAIPLAAAVPAKPTKCPEPMLEENSDPATGIKNMVLEARKKSPTP